MAYWWDSSTNERYWVEITSRDDVGVDLHCPKTNEKDRSYWSYDLIKELLPGDIVFHYHTPFKAFIGASVIGFPLKEYTHIWIPHGTVGRSKNITDHLERSGWLLPIYRFLPAQNPLTLEQVLADNERDWVYQWINNKETEIEKRRSAGENDLQTLVAAPFQRYGKNTGKNTLRGLQGYLAKMPADFVNRWEQLSVLVDLLATEQEELETIKEVFPILTVSRELEQPPVKFKPKNEEEYVAYIKGGIQRRTRKHENLISRAAEFLKNAGFDVSNPHPIDLFITEPRKVIFEGKIVPNQKHLFAIRYAVGQLYEYRFFLNHRDALLCILLDSEPSEELIGFAELELNLLIAWMIDEDMVFGKNSEAIFNEILS